MPREKAAAFCLDSGHSRKLHDMKREDRVKQGYCQWESKNQSLGKEKGGKYEGAEIYGQEDVCHFNLPPLQKGVESCRFNNGQERFLKSANCMWRDGVR